MYFTIVRQSSFIRTGAVDPVVPPAVDSTSFQAIRHHGAGENSPSSPEVFSSPGVRPGEAPGDGVIAFATAQPDLTQEFDLTPLDTCGTPEIVPSTLGPVGGSAPPASDEVRQMKSKVRSCDVFPLHSRTDWFSAIYLRSQNRWKVSSLVRTPFICLKTVFYSPRRGIQWSSCHHG